MERTRWAAWLCAALLMACGGKPPEEEPPEETPAQETPDAGTSREVRDIALYDASGKNFAWSHGDHWHGYIAFNQGQPLEVRFKYMGDKEGHESDPNAHFSLEGQPDVSMRVGLLDATMVSFTGDHVQGRFEDKLVGLTYATFTLRRGVETLLRTPEVRVVIRE
jgi:hypothetical protein